MEQTEEARVEVMCFGEEVARKAVEALKRWVLLFGLFLKIFDDFL